MLCYICDTEITQEMIMTVDDDMIYGFYSIVIRGNQIPICSSCFPKWNRILELLLIRFKEQQYIDENICKKIIDYTDDNKKGKSTVT